MKIAYVGNFSQSHCTEVHLAATLEDLGHDVVRIQETEERGRGTWILQTFDCDLFLYTRTWGKMVTLLELETLAAHNIPTASYHLDLYVGLSRKYLHEGKTLDEVLQTDPFWRTDFVFTPDGDPRSQEVFERNGVKHHYMKPGVFKPECQMIGTATIHPESAHNKTLPLIDFSHMENEVLFVGGGDRAGSPNGYGHPEWPYRDDLISWLYDTYGDQFTKFGHPQQTIRNKELNKLYGTSKVVVGDSVCLNLDHEYYWSDRVYETLGRGGFLIHPYIKGMEEEFKDGVHLRYYEYGNFSQLRELIDYYLEHDEERERIRKAGHEFVKNHATYSDRLQQMLKIVFPNSPDVATPAAKALMSFGRFDAKRAYDSPEIISADKINLGSGNDPLPGYVNVDMLNRDDVDVVHNLMDFPYPFEDGCATSIKAIDVIEHLDNYTDDKRPTIMAFIEECARILKPGSELYIQAPSWDSEIFKIDPTHVRGFHINTFDFFDPDTEYGKIRDFYGGPKFKVRAEELENKNLRFWMVKR